MVASGYLIFCGIPTLTIMMIIYFKSVLVGIALLTGATYLILTLVEASEMVDNRFYSWLERNGHIKQPSPMDQALYGDGSQIHRELQGLRPIYKDDDGTN